MRGESEWKSWGGRAFHRLRRPDRRENTEKEFASRLLQNLVFRHPMPFEFDPYKSESNLKKHGIAFEEAQSLWKSKVVEFAAKANSEKRYLVIGVIGRTHWSAVITYKGMTRRLISVRKSTPQEIDLYAENVPNKR